MAGGRISDEDVAKVREATDLVQLISERTQVKQRGRDFWACCPLHQEKTPSFKIDPSTGLWHCFGCGEGGDAFGFIMKADDLSFPEAVRKLADRAHIQIEETAEAQRDRSSKQRLKDACAEAADFYHMQLMRSKSKDAQSARDYLSSRGMGGEIPRRWKLGFAPGRSALIRHLSSKGFTYDEMKSANLAVVGKDGRLHDRFFNRVMFPILDQQGECIAFGGRIIGSGEPKYLNSQETPIFRKSQVLYGLDRAKAKMTATGTAIITEGYTDVIAMHEAGLENTVATLGTALTKSHLRMLGRHAGKKIVYIFDGDAAGQRATERALQFIDEGITPESGNRRMDIYALTLPEDLDPKEFLDAYSADRMRELIEEAKPLIAFGIERRLSRHDISSSEGRVAALTDALQVLAPIRDSILAKDYAAKLAGTLRFREEDVLDQLSKLKKPVSYDDRPTAGDATRSQAQADRSTVSSRAPLSTSQKNRLSLERELLAYCATNPLDALKNADRLRKTVWHDAVHDEVAKAIVSVLSENPSASSAQIVEAASRASRHAPSILTSSTLDDSSLDRGGIDYILAQLEAGDIEDRIYSLKSQLGIDAEGEESDRLFEEMIALQARLNTIRGN